MAPTYMDKNPYASVIDTARELAHASFEIDGPKPAIERDVLHRF